MVNKAIWLSLILVLTLGLGGGFLSPCFSQGTETLTITTYYPSPFGAYKEMTVSDRLAIGDLNGSGGVDSSDMAVNNSNAPIIGSLTVSSNIGIGTNKPQAQLDVVGGVKVGRFNETCDNTKAGTLRWVNSDKELQCCDGTAWKAVVFRVPTTCIAGDEIHGASYNCYVGFGSYIIEGCKWCQCDVSAGPDKGVWDCTYYCPPNTCPVTAPW